MKRTASKCARHQDIHIIGHGSFQDVPDSRFIDRQPFLIRSQHWNMVDGAAQVIISTKNGSDNTCGMASADFMMVPFGESNRRAEKELSQSR